MNVLIWTMIAIELICTYINDFFVKMISSNIKVCAIYNLKKLRWLKWLSKEVILK